jgi:hypothetical protein
VAAIPVIAPLLSTWRTVAVVGNDVGTQIVKTTQMTMSTYIALTRRGPR